MSRKVRTLIDVEQGVYLGSGSFTEPLKNPNGSGSTFCRIDKRRLRGGLSDGVDVVEIDNGRLALTVLPTRGMGIWRGRCGDVELKWNSPIAGPVHPSFVPIADPGGLGWLEGFDEWLVRCGLESNGSPEFDAEGKLRYPLHGQLANLPAQTVTLTTDRESGEIELFGRIRESKLFFKKLELTTTLKTQTGASTFTVIDTVTNLSAEPGEFELLYHINTGNPFAAPGGRLVMPFERMAPRTEDAVRNLPLWSVLCPETPGSAEVVFFFEPAVDAENYCTAMLVNPNGDRGLVLSFDQKALPYFSFWKSRLSDADGYVCGIEPSVNFPNNRSFEKEQGRVVPLAPGESRSHELRFEILHDAEAVREKEREIEKIGGAAVIDSTPRKEWTP